MANVPTKPCISFSIPKVQLPSIFIAPPGLSLTFPPPPNIPNGVPCCIFKVPSFSPTIPLPPLPIGPIMAALNTAIAAAMAILPQVQVPTCNL